MQKISSFIEPFPYIVIDRLFDDEEYLEMAMEWVDLQTFGLPPEKTSGARTAENKNVKHNSGIFLDEMYSENRDASATLRINRKLFSETLLSSLENLNPTYGLLRASSIDKTLLSFYYSDDYYGTHFDYNTVTALTYFLPKSKCFSGGVLRFTDYGVEIEPKNNQTIIFIGSVRHEVTPLQGPNGLLRITMSQFVGNWRWG